jgi:hypothetical protein
MNKIIFILLFLSVTLCTKSFAHINHAPTAKKSFILGKHKSADFSTSNKAPDSQKNKKRAKGIQPEFCYFFSENIIFKPNMIKSDCVLPIQKKYFFHVFFSNEKRGPPAVL